MTPRAKRTMTFASANLIYIAILYATVPLVPRFTKSLVERHGYSVYNWIYLPFALLGMALLWHVLRRTEKGKRLFTLSGLGAISLAYAVILPNLKYGVERMHFLQYGLLAFLLVGLFAPYLRDVGLYVWTVLLVYLLSLGDEAIQGALPNRVGEIADVTLNVYSALLGLAATAISMPAWRPGQWVTRTSLNLLAGSMLPSVLLTLLFMAKVHGFGYEIRDGQTGDFNSSLDSAALLETNIKMRDPQSVPEELRWTYDNEAYRHLFQREFYDTNRFMANDGSYYIDWRKSRNENRVLEKYYSAYLEHQSKTWPPGHNTGSVEKDLPWKSRVKGTLITRFRFGTAAVTGLSLGAILSVLCLFLRRFAPGDNPDAPN